MTPLTPPPAPVGGSAPRTIFRSIFLWCSGASFVGAVAVFLLGVVWTNGTYGSRMAWLLGVVLPLLLLAALLAWLASPHTPRQRRAPDYVTAQHGWARSVQSRTSGVPKSGAARKLFIVSGVLFAIPIALGMALLLVYVALLVRYFLVH